MILLNSNISISLSPKSMASRSCFLNNHLMITGLQTRISKQRSNKIIERHKFTTKRRAKRVSGLTLCHMNLKSPSSIEFPIFDTNPLEKFSDFHALTRNVRIGIIENSVLLFADLDPSTAKLAIGILGPSLSAFSFLFIARIVMSWYPNLPVGKFPYVLAYGPTEPILVVTRKVIPPLGGVDVTPVVWFGLVSFLNEILVGPQGLLVLVSQQVN